MNTDIKKIAEKIYEARKENKTALSPADVSKLKIEEAYAINREVVKLAVKDGVKTAGFKIALGGETAQKKYNTDEPAYGYITSDLCYTSGSDIKLAENGDYKIECELAFVLGRDMIEMPKTIDELADSVAYIFPALELVDTARVSVENGASGFVLENSIFAGVIWGDRIAAVQETDMELTGMRLEINCKLRTSGIAFGVMGNPLNALMWIAQKRSEQGLNLKEGDIVLTGSFVPAEAVKPGDIVRASFYKLGDIIVNLV